MHLTDSIRKRVGTRGEDQRSEDLFTYLRLEQRIAADHPLRAIRTLVDAALAHRRMRRLDEHQRWLAQDPSPRLLLVDGLFVPTAAAYNIVRHPQRYGRGGMAPSGPTDNATKTTCIRLRRARPVKARG